MANVQADDDYVGRLVRDFSSLDSDALDARVDGFVSDLGLYGPASLAGESPGDRVRRWISDALDRVRADLCAHWRGIQRADVADAERLSIGLTPVVANSLGYQGAQIPLAAAIAVIAVRRGIDQVCR